MREYMRTLPFTCKINYEIEYFYRKKNFKKLKLTFKVKENYYFCFKQFELSLQSD